MKSSFCAKCAAAVALAAAFASAEPVRVDVRSCGARESDLLQTSAIQSAIDRVAAAGGGEVVIPEGRFRTGGLVLRSGVTLRLEDGAELMGDANPDNYPGDRRWYRALVRADGARDIGIVGGRQSRINGVNVYDPRGEENFRGPHAIMFIGCTNVTLKGYTVRDSANWAHALFHCGNVMISGVRVFGGHDAVDFHDSTDVTVENCELRTGDDCIAGFANHRCRVRDCVLDTSCQAVRIGGADILVERCRVVYPSSFGHRYGLPAELKRAGATAGEHCKHGMVAGVIYYCDARWQIDRPQRDLVFRDCVFDHPKRIFSLDYDGRNMWCCRHPLESVVFERCTFDAVEEPIAIYGDAEKPLDFTLRDCTVSAAPGCGDRELLTAYNFGRLTLENVTLVGFQAPRLVTRSRGEVVVRGGTSVENVYRPDPLDRTLTFAECAAELEKLPGDDAAWEKWAAGRPTPPESRWSDEKGLYVTEDPLVVDVWGSALAAFRGDTPHVSAIARRLCCGYMYYVGWDRTGAVKPSFDGELSPLPAGPFGYAMAQFDPLFARTFFTDFVRRADKPPAAVSGVRLALKKLIDGMGQKNLKVLMIGNSFSISNIREMPSVAAAMGCPLDLSSLCIGGCSLERHWNNLVASTNVAFKPYGFERNVRGKTLFMDVPSNLRTVLTSDRWDVITLQQASHFSWKPETYEPFLGDLIREIGKLQPQAEIVLQETWSYTPWDRRLAKWGMTADEMYAKIRAACRQRASAHRLRMIPTGTAVDLYRKELPVVYAENSFGGDPCGGRWGGAFVRDEKTGKWHPGKDLDVFHLGYEGEYLQALVWTSTLFGVDVTKCPYVPNYVKIPERAVKMKRCAQKAVSQ